MPVRCHEGQVASGPTRACCSCSPPSAPKCSSPRSPAAPGTSTRPSRSACPKTAARALHPRAGTAGRNDRRLEQAHRQAEPRLHQGTRPPRGAGDAGAGRQRAGDGGFRAGAGGYGQERRKAERAVGGGGRGGGICVSFSRLSPPEAKIVKAGLASFLRDTTEEGRSPGDTGLGG